MVNLLSYKYHKRKTTEVTNKPKVHAGKKTLLCQSCSDTYCTLKDFYISFNRIWCLIWSKIKTLPHLLSRIMVQFTIYEDEELRCICQNVFHEVCQTLYQTARMKDYVLHTWTVEKCGA